MFERQKKSSPLRLVLICVLSVLIGLTLSFFLLGTLSHYFYLKDLGNVSLLRPFFHQSFKNTILSSASLLFHHWRLLYQRRILIILALIISFPFVRRWVRQKMSHRVGKRPILKKIYRWAPWIRAIILTWLVVYYIIYGLSKQMGEKLAQKNVALWNQYIEHCMSVEASHVQTFSLNNKTYRCAYIIAIKNQTVLFFVAGELHIFNLITRKEIAAWNVKKQLF